jgi:outer membrane protein assembly factor BamD (BamD/ComL family)
MRFYKHFLLLLAGSLLFFAYPCLAKDKKVYVVEEKGRSTLVAALEKQMPTSAEQWEYAREMQNRGWLKKADRRMLYLVRRWPNSQEAPWAQRSRADMLFSRGKLKDAFKEYQYLIDNYSSRMRDYDSVLESQFDIAVDVMNRRRMRWIFGGFRAPEYAVDYFEDVIRNGPQWSRAPEAQFLIGQCYQQAKELEMAISAYGVLGYRYPDSSFAEEAAWQQIVCLDKLRKEYPHSLEILDRVVTTTEIFKSIYPKSVYYARITQLRNRLYEVKAGKAFAEAEFYAKVPKKPEAAIIYYEQMMKEYHMSKLVPEAQKRIDEIKQLMVRPPVAPAAASTKPPPLISEKESDNAEE